MAERLPIQDNDQSWEETIVFLARRGIVPVNGVFTEQQLSQALTRRGWRWNVEPGRVIATKAFTTSGTVSQSYSVQGADQVAALTSVLVKAIRFDEEHGLGLSRRMHADIVIRAPDQRVIAIVEVKAIDGLTDYVATQMRSNLVGSSSSYALAPFFILLSQDYGYFWDQRSSVLPSSPPARKFAMAPVVDRYLTWLAPGERPGGSELEQAAAAWLDDLANPFPHRPPPLEEFFAGTGFLDAIRGGLVLTDAAA